MLVCPGSKDYYLFVFLFQTRQRVLVHGHVAPGQADGGLLRVGPAGAVPPRRRLPRPRPPAGRRHPPPHHPGRPARLARQDETVQGGMRRFEPSAPHPGLDSEPYLSDTNITCRYLPIQALFTSQPSLNLFCIEERNCDCDGKGAVSCCRLYLPLWTFL